MLKATCCDNLPYTKDPRTKKVLCKDHFTHFIIKRVKKTIDTYTMIEKYDNIGIGYSGGKDSTVLLNILSKTMRHKTFDEITVITIVSLTFLASAVLAWVPLLIEDDPLVRMPGTQPAQAVNLEGPNRCLNCHAGYDQAVEPGFNWKG